MRAQLLGARRIFRSRRWVRGGLHVVDRCVMPPPPCEATPAERASPRDSQKPRPERGLSPKAIERAKRANECVLCHFFRVLSVAERRQRGAIDSRLVSFDEPVAGVAVAMACQLDQLCVRHTAYRPAVTAAGWE